MISLIVKDDQEFKVTDIDFMPIVGQEIMLEDKIYIIKSVKWQMDIGNQNATMIQVVDIIGGE